MQFCHADVVSVKVLAGYQLYLQFEDGVDGVIDISQLVPFEGVFKPLQDKKYFAKVSVNTDIGTICWDNGADLSPSCLYEHLQPKS